MPLTQITHPASTLNFDINYFWSEDYLVISLKINSETVAIQIPFEKLAEKLGPHLVAGAEPEGN